MSEKQRRFVEFYMGQARGNATEAARLAGYKGNDKTLAVVGAENLRKPCIAAAIAERIQADPAVLTREELQAFWSRVVRDESADLRARLEASNLLAKSHAMFVQKAEVGGRLTLADLARMAEEDGEGVEEEAR